MRKTWCCRFIFILKWINIATLACFVILGGIFIFQNQSMAENSFDEIGSYYIFIIDYSCVLMGPHEIYENSPASNISFVLYASKNFKIFVGIPNNKQKNLPQEKMQGQFSFTEYHTNKSKEYKAIFDVRVAPGDQSIMVISTSYKIKDVIESGFFKAKRFSIEAESFGKIFLAMPRQAKPNTIVYPDMSSDDIVLEGKLFRFQRLIDCGNSLISQN